MRSARLTLAGLLLVAVTVSGCGEAKPTAPIPVTLRLDHRVSGAPLTEYVLDTPFTNAFGNAFGVTRLVYFLSDVTLTPEASGEPARLAGGHYVDHEQAATRTVELSLPGGTEKVTTLTFTFGLPAASNVTGQFAQPPQSLMEWPETMGGGYHYMKFEGRYLDANNNLAPFKVHSGPAMGEDYSFPVTLDASALALAADAEGTRSLTLVMNLEQWFEGPNVWNLQEQFQPPTHGMMDSPAKQASLRENGGTVFALEVP